MLLSIPPCRVVAENLPEKNEVKPKHPIIAAGAIVALTLIACENKTPPLTVDTRKTEQITATPTTGMQAIATIFASDRGRDWEAHKALSEVEWEDSVPQEFAAGHYSRSGKILLLGLPIKEIPNGKPGPDYAMVKRNEGESTLTVIGTLSGVDSVSISKPLYSDDYLSILKKQFGLVAAIAIIADQCLAPGHEAGEGGSAFFELSLAGNKKVYIQASQKDGGKYTDGFTVFDLTRNKPSKAIAEMNCKSAR